MSDACLILHKTVCQIHSYCPCLICTSGPLLFRNVDHLLFYDIPLLDLSCLVRRTVLDPMGSSSFYVSSDSVVLGCSSIVCVIITILENCFDHTISVSTLQSYIAVSVSYSLLEAIFMKDSALILNESRALSFRDDHKIICRIVNAWLTKELRKHRN